MRDKQPPVWDFGLGVGAVSFDDYRGADTTHVYVLPVPYLYYRGNFLKADRNGIRGKLFRQDWIELNISAGATTPVRRNATRAGMPDLTLHRGDRSVGRSASVQIGGRAHQVRCALAAARPHSRFKPDRIRSARSSRRNAAIDIKDVLGFQGWYFGALAGPLFADHRYHDYFYTVAPQFATPERPAYKATRRLRGCRISRCAVETLSLVLGGSVRAARHARGRRIREQPTRETR